MKKGLILIVSVVAVCAFWYWQDEPANDSPLALEQAGNEYDHP